MNCEDLLKELTRFSCLDVRLIAGVYYIFQEDSVLSHSNKIYDVLKFLLNYISYNLEDFWL